MIENTVVIIIIGIITVLGGQFAIYHYYLEEKLYNKLNNHVNEIIKERLNDAIKNTSNIKHESCIFFGNPSEDERKDIQEALSTVRYLMDKGKEQDRVRLFIKALSEKTDRDILGDRRR